MYIAYATRHFAANNETAMRMQHLAILDQNIFGRSASLSSCLVGSRLQADSIITHIKCAFLYQHVTARFQVQAITISGIPFILHVAATNGQFAAQFRMQVPHRGVLERNTFEQDTLTFIEPQILGTNHILVVLPRHQPIAMINLLALTKCTFGNANRDPTCTVFCQNAMNRICHKCRPLFFGSIFLTNRTPVLAAAVDDTFARDGYIGCPISYNGSLSLIFSCSEQLIARLIERHLGEKLHISVSLQIQLNMTTQDDGTCEPLTSGDVQCASTQGIEVMNSRDKSFRTCISSHSTKIGQCHFPIRDLRQGGRHGIGAFAI